MPDNDYSHQANEAVSAIGTNGIPTLLRLLRAKDSNLKIRVMGLLQRQHIVKIEYTPAEHWNVAAAAVFVQCWENWAAMTSLPCQS
jgi:hypothetical protein